MFVGCVNNWIIRCIYVMVMINACDRKRKGTMKRRDKVGKELKIRIENEGTR